TRIDPRDAHAWYNLGYTAVDNPALQQECYEKALQRDPYLRRALNGLQVLVRPEDPKRADELLKTFAGLNKLADPEKQRYGDMGRYAEVIGRIPNGPQAFGPIPPFARDDKFQVSLKPGTRWARSADFGQGAAAELRRAVRKRFGATLVVLDFNRDGKPDLLLLGAVVEDGQVRDLLLRNDGDDRFTDVTHEAGLAEPRLSLGCTVGDFDNDGFPDLFITGIGRQWLFRNQGKAEGRRFADVTAQAGLDKLDGICLGSCFVDLDQDGDLDLVVARYAITAAEALESLAGTRPKGAAGFAIFLNVGEAKPSAPSVDPPPLTPAFTMLPLPAGLLGSEAAVALAATDLDRDGDLDLVLLSDHTAGTVLLNDRLLRFRRAPLPKALIPSRLWNGVLVLDAHHEGRSDLFLLSPDQAPVCLAARVAQDEKELEQWLTKGACNSPPLLQALAIDLDYDGWTDIVGLSDQRLPVLLQNQQGKLAHVPEGLGSDSAWPKDLVAVAAGNFNGDKLVHLLVWSETSGLHLFRNGGNGHYALQLELTGHRHAQASGSTSRCNADGFGVRVAVQTGNFYTAAEATTFSAGLGQSRQPLLLGLGKHSQAEVVRLRWPDNCWQAELNKPAFQRIRIEETNRKPDSCPLLFTWNGQRFTFVTDFLGGAALGEVLPDRTCRQPRPEEAIKIEARQLVPKDGFYVLKLTEPMNEITYLDHLQLIVVDHPDEVRAYPDERLTATGPPPSQKLLAFRSGDEVFPVKAVDHHGRDVTRTLRYWDRDTVAGFARRAWTGFAEEHWVEVDFGNRLAGFGANEPLTLFLAGWTDYPFPDSEWAASQAGVVLQPPILEKRGAGGQWHILLPDAGFPAGLPRMMAVDVTGKLTGPRCVLRLRSNMTVFWDQIFVAPINGSKGKTSIRTTTLEVAAASLEERGCALEFSPDGKEPAIYDYDRLDKVAVTRQAGSLTRVGDVAEFLQSRDDRFVIFGPGDEVTVKFDSRQLPPLPSGWSRSFVLQTCGYVKACGPLVASGDTVEPLPFHKMSRFPYAAGETYPQTPLHQEYRQRYNTRQVGPARDAWTTRPAGPTGQAK
ncbi:MAG TPA: VCBS repeat-containing protein, partial [Gemmataceae bacterium]|nr:VCBS repeat-containing protein [Gemmataceae bacterium]